jgi:hypothetical protein
MQHSPSSRKLITVQLIKILSLNGMRSSVPCTKQSVNYQANSVQALQSYIFKIHFNIILPSTCTLLKMFMFPFRFPNNISVCIFCLHHVLHNRRLKLQNYQILEMEFDAIPEVKFCHENWNHTSTYVEIRSSEF